MISLPPIKRGDTFYIGGLKKDSNNEPQDLTDFTIRSQIRSASTKKIINEFEVIKLNQTTYKGKFSISSATDTWPIGVCLIDIEFRKINTIVSSETMQIYIMEDITHD